MTKKEKGKTSAYELTAIFIESMKDNYKKINVIDGTEEEKEDVKKLIGQYIIMLDKQLKTGGAYSKMRAMTLYEPSYVVSRLNSCIKKNKQIYTDSKTGRKTKAVPISVLEKLVKQLED